MTGVKGFLQTLTREGLFTTRRLKFNSVTERLFVPFIHQIRGVTGDPTEVTLERQAQELDRLVRPNFKFKNYAWSSLVPGQKVIGALWQPEIRTKLVTLLGRAFYRTLALTHLLILTDRELIVVREDEIGPRARGESHYGGV